MRTPQHEPSPVVDSATARAASPSPSGIALAGDLLAWMPMLALPGTEVRRWEPKRLRLRLFTIPATRVHHARRRLVHLAETAPPAHLAKQAIDRLRELRRLGMPLAVPG